MRSIARAVLVGVLAVALALVALEVSLELASRWIGPRRGDTLSLATASLVVYGDSTPYGLGNDVAFPVEISRQTGLPVANRSWPGLNSTQVARILVEDLQSISPRVLIVMAGVNDGWNIEDVDPSLLGESARWYQTLPRLRTLRLLAIGLEAGLGRNEYESAVARGWGHREETARLLETDAVRRILSTSYRRMQEAARAHGAEILFLGYQAEGYNHVGDLAEEVLRAEHPDRTVHLRDLFMKDGDRSMIQPDNFHPTDAGQLAIASRVVAELRARGWVSARGPEPPARP